MFDAIISGSWLTNWASSEWHLYGCVMPWYCHHGGKQLNEMCLKKMLKTQMNHASQISHMSNYCFYHHSACLWSYTVEPWGNATHFTSRNLDLSSLYYHLFLFLYPRLDYQAGKAGPRFTACQLEFGKELLIC